MDMELNLIHCLNLKPNNKSMKVLRIRIILDIICFVKANYKIPFALSLSILGPMTFLQNGLLGLDK